MKLGWEYWNWGKLWLNNVVGLINHSPMENVINYLFNRFIYLFRNNCFRLSMEDSLDCCRHCMMIREIETNQLDYVIECDGGINALNMWIVGSVYMTICLNTLYMCIV